MTARDREAGQESELHGYLLIARTRRAVPRLAGESLDRIRGLVERALSGEGSSAAVIDELERTLGPDA